MTHVSRIFKRNRKFTDPSSVENKRLIATGQKVPPKLSAPFA
jgi:hypothetical protein